MLAISWAALLNLKVYTKMSTQDSLQAMLAASLQPKSGFLGMPDYVDPRQSQAIMSKIQQMDYAQQYPVMQQGAVQAGQGLGNFLQGLVGHFRGNSAANPDQGFLSNLSQALGQQGQTGMNQTFPAIAPQAGDGGGPASMPDPSQGQDAPSPQQGAPSQQQGGAPTATGGSRLPGTQTDTSADQAMRALYLHTLQTTGDEVQARIAAGTLGVQLGRNSATDVLSKAQNDLVARNKMEAETLKDNGQGASAYNEIDKRASDTTNNVMQRSQEDTRLGIEQQNATTNANRAASGDGAAWSGPGLQYAVDQKLTTGKDPTRMSKPMQAEYFNALGVRQMQTGDTQGAAASRIAGIKADGASLAMLSKTYDNTSAYVATMDKNLAAADAAAKQINFGDVTMLNDAYAKWLKGTSDPAYAKYNIYFDSVGNELAKIKSGSFGNTPISDPARKENLELMHSSIGTLGRDAVFEAVKTEGRNRISSLADQMKATRDRLSGVAAPGSINAPSTVPGAPQGQTQAQTQIKQDAGSGNTRTYDPSTGTFK